MGYDIERRVFTDEPEQISSSRIVRYGFQLTPGDVGFVPDEIVQLGRPDERILYLDGLAPVPSIEDLQPGFEEACQAKKASDAANGAVNDDAPPRIPALLRVMCIDAGMVVDHTVLDKGGPQPFHKQYTNFKTVHYAQDPARFIPVVFNIFSDEDLLYYTADLEAAGINMERTSLTHLMDHTWQNAGTMAVRSLVQPGETERPASTT